MTRSRYIHGFDSEEQARLERQADYWADSVIPHGLDYRPGDRVLEVGCATGASLGKLAERFEGLQLAGLDLEPRQIAIARRHLPEADLRVGDARALPWKDATFERVYVMWLLEHLPDPGPVLDEIVRVLKPGGQVTLTETDYAMHTCHPHSEGFAALARAQVDLFAHRGGNPHVGSQLGAALRCAGLERVRAQPLGFQLFEPQAIAAHARYMAEFLEPMIPMAAHELGRSEDLLRRGLDDMLALHTIEGASLTTVVFRAHGWRSC